MAITISGENNNDKILATDGVIDEISGINIVGLLTAGHLNVGSNIQLGNAGIITATTFNGNLNGNVNSTSPLLLQTGGSERFRITGNNELGIAGANYGTSGQVLTSGGSGSAVSWATPAVTSFTSGANNRVVTATSGSGLNGEANLTYNGSSQLKLSGTGQQDFIIGSTNAGGTYLILDGDSNGDAIGSDYAYIAHDTGGDVIIGGDNPSGNADIIIKAGNNSEKVRITSGGQLLVGNFSSGNSNNLIHARLANGSIASNSTASVILAENSANTWITIGSGASNYGGILFADSGSSDIGQVRYNHSTNALEFLTNGGNTSNIRLLITSDGKVGINQSTPTEDLEVKGDQTATIFINSGQHDASTAQEATLKLGFNQSHANDSIGYVKLIEQGNNAFDGDLAFAVPYNNSGTPATREVLRAKWNGNVGINETAPTSQLTVRATSDDNPSIRMYRQSTGGDVASLIWTTGSGNQASINYRGGGGDVGMQFYTNGTSSTDQKLRISTNGQILQFANAGDNQFVSKRIGNAGSNGDYFFHMRAQDSNGNNVGELGFHRDTALDDARFIIKTRNTGGSSQERLRIDSSGRALFSGTLGYGNIPLGGNPANAAIQIRCNSKYNGIAFGENAVSGCIGLGGDSSSTAMVFVANAHPANLGGGTKDIFEWWSGTAGGGGPGKYMTLDTGGHLALTSGNLEFANGAGIDFSNVPDGSRSLQTDGNKLDDYEEGYWTPTLYYNNGTSEPSYSWRYGHYIKVGRQVTVWFNIGISNFTASYSQAYIGGLPFQAADPHAQWKYLNHMMGYSFASGWGDQANDNQMFLAIYDNQTKMMINHEGNHLSTGNIGSGQRFSCTVTYQTD